MTLRMDYLPMTQPRVQAWPDRESLTWLARDPVKLISLVAMILAGVVIALCVVVSGMSHSSGMQKSELDTLQQQNNTQQVEIDELRNRQEALNATHS